MSLSPVYWEEKALIFFIGFVFVSLTMMVSPLISYRKVITQISVCC